MKVLLTALNAHYMHTSLAIRQLKAACRGLRDIETELQNSLVSEITSKDIGEMVLSRLREIDIVSYIRFASVYREFKDIDSFMEEIRILSGKGRKRARPEGDKKDD